MASAGRPALTPGPSPDSYPSPEGRARGAHGHGIHSPTQNFESHPILASAVGRVVP